MPGAHMSHHIGYQRVQLPHGHCPTVPAWMLSVSGPGQSRCRAAACVPVVLCVARVPLGHPLPSTLPLGNPSGRSAGRQKLLCNWQTFTGWRSANSVSTWFSHRQEHAAGRSASAVALASPDA